MRASRPTAWFLLATLASCGDPIAGPAIPDAGLQVTERGIGGTGGLTGGPGASGAARPLPAPGSGASVPRPSDRGIGGIGMASAETADTGLVGMITGFGSIFVNGLEVGFDSSARVTMDDAPVPSSALRVGQIAVLDVDPVIDARSRTTGIAVRHEVAGRVARVGADGLLTVSGQPVRLSASTLGDSRPHAGDWIAVSGFRNPAGEIAATRIDPAPRGHMVVHGILRWDQGALHVGELPIETAGGTPVPSGGPVNASGPDAGGALHADRLTPDLLAANPAIYFGPMVRHFLIEGYGAAHEGGFEPGRGPPSATQRSVARFERGSNGSLVAGPPHGEGIAGRNGTFVGHEPAHGIDPGGSATPGYGPAPVSRFGLSEPRAGSAPAPDFTPGSPGSGAFGGGSEPGGGNAPGNALPMRPPFRPGH